MKLSLITLFMLVFSSFSSTLLAEPLSKQQTSHADTFFKTIQQFCGKTFIGKSVYPKKESDSFYGKKLVATVKTCEKDIVKIPFWVGEDQSRTWIITRDNNRLLLKHDHRDKSGHPHKLTNYGGWSTSSGNQYQQSFAADEQTFNLIPEAKTNVWTLSLDPDTQELTYYLERHQKPRFKAILQLVK